MQNKIENPLEWDTFPPPRPPPISEEERLHIQELQSGVIKLSEQRAAEIKANRAEADERVPDFFE